MKRLIPFLLLIFVILVNCAAPKQNVRWSGRLVENELSPPYTYWNDGVQFLEAEQNGIQMNLSGSRIGKYVYIFVSIYNNSDEIINLFPASAKLVQANGKSKVDAKPVLPRHIRKIKNTSSTFVSILYATSVAANAVAIANSSSSSDKAILDTRNDILTIEHNLAQNKLNADTSDLIGLMLKNHTLYPNEHYYGFILFDKLKEKIKMNSTFGLMLPIADENFKVVGKFLNILKYDELDLPKDVRGIVFK